MATRTMTAANAAMVSQKARRGHRRVSGGTPWSVPADQKLNGEPMGVRIRVQQFGEGVTQAGIPTLLALGVLGPILSGGLGIPVAPGGSTRRLLMPRRAAGALRFLALADAVLTLLTWPLQQCSQRLGGDYCGDMMSGQVLCALHERHR